MNHSLSAYKWSSPTDIKRYMMQGAQVLVALWVLNYAK